MPACYNVLAPKLYVRGPFSAAPDAATSIATYLPTSMEYVCALHSCGLPVTPVHSRSSVVIIPSSSTFCDCLCNRVACTSQATKAILVRIVLFKNTSRMP